MSGALALAVALSVASQIQVHPTGLKSVGLSHGRAGVRTVQILDKLYEQAGKPSLDFDFARYGDLHDNATGETSLVTFSRASSGTYVGADGLIKRALVNQALYSEQFEQWTNSNTADLANQVDAPDGKQTADEIEATAANGTIRRGVTTTAIDYTFSVYIKRKSGTGNIDISADGTTWVTQSVTGDWQRFSVTQTGVAGTSNPGIRIVTSGDEVYAWGAQLVEGTDPGPYIRTTSAVGGQPRFDHDPVTGESLGLLVEEARTNLLKYSRDLTQADWVDTDVTVALDQTGADGVTSSASSLTATAGNGTVLQAVTSASAARATSAYVKRITGTGTIEMTQDGGSTWTAVTVTAAWTRVTIPSATVTDPEVGFRIVTSGDAIAVDFVQLETGAFSTSAIPTTTVAATRAADVAAVQDADFSTTNLLSYSESFDVGWTRQAINAFGSGSVANAIVAPDGQTTADYLQEDNTTASHQVYLVNVPIVSGTTYTFSIYAKAAERTAVAFNSSSAAFGTQEFATYDLASGTVGAQGTSGSATIQAVGNGWYRLTRTITSTASITTGAAWGLSNSPTAPRLASYAGDGTSGIYLWGASLTATEYPVVYTTTRNLLTDSQDFERGTWVKANGVVSDDAAQAPDGTLTADKFIGTSGQTSMYIYQNLVTSVTSGQLYTNSVYAKAGEFSYLQITGSVHFTSLIANFDLINGTVAYADSGVPASIQDVGNGWYRCSVMLPATSTATGGRFIYALIGSGTDARLASSKVGNSTDGLYLWGAQLEPGTVATDYVRTVDTVGKAYRWYEPTEGTALVKVNVFNDIQSGVLAFRSSSTNNERAQIYENGSATNFAAQIRDTANINTMQQNYIGEVSGENILALAFAKDNGNNAANGNVSTADTSLNVPVGIDYMQIGLSFAVTQYNGHIKRLTYWPRRQPDATLQVITQ